MGIKRDDMVYVRHILDAISAIEEYVSGKNFKDFEANMMLKDAVIRELEIIGEATKNISIEFRS